MSKLNECPNRLPDGKCLIRESEIQGSDLLRNMPCLMTQAFHCEHYDLKVNPKSLERKQYQFMHRGFHFHTYLSEYQAHTGSSK